MPEAVIDPVPANQVVVTHVPPPRGHGQLKDHRMPACSRKEEARAVVRRAIEEDRLLDPFRGERPYNIRPDYMSSSNLPQNYETMWDELAEAMQHDDGVPHGRLVETMRVMTETASDAYLLAYALVVGLDRQKWLSIPIDLNAMLALLRQSLPKYEAELSVSPDPSGSLPEGKWSDLKRLQANTGVPPDPSFASPVSPVTTATRPRRWRAERGRA